MAEFLNVHPNTSTAVVLSVSLANTLCVNVFHRGVYVCERVKKSKESNLYYPVIG